MTVLRGPGLIVVVVGAEDRIRQPGRPLDELTLARGDVASVVGAVENLVRPSGCEGLNRLAIELGATGLGEVAEVDALQSVAGSADLLVDLEAALQLLLVEAPLDAGEAPILTLDMGRRGITGCSGRRRGEGKPQARDGQRSHCQPRQTGNPEG
jgi:hypothetical protein